MLGPLSYYRTFQLRFDEEKGKSRIQLSISLGLIRTDSRQLLDAKLSSPLPEGFPILFFWGTEDPSCSAKHVKHMDKFVKDIRSIKLEGKGHWLMVEAPDVIIQETLQFLNERLRSGESTIPSPKL